MDNEYYCEDCGQLIDSWDSSDYECNSCGVTICSNCVVTDNDEETGDEIFLCEQCSLDAEMI